MSSTARTMLVTGLCLLTVAACSGGNSGGQQTSTGSPAPTTSSTAKLAPSVDQPLSFDSYTSRVCDILKPAQLKAVDEFEPSKITESSLGPDCSWRPVNYRGISVGVTLATKLSGLEEIYQRKDTYPYFAVADKIANYPAVNTNERSNSDAGDCYQYVGISNDRAFRVSVHVRNEQDPKFKTPCTIASQISAEVIKTLQGGG